MSPCSSLDRPRAVPLDGALITFDRRTGVALIAEGDETRELVMRAPRVVQMGITNACNFSCEYCSRPLDAKSEWTAESAFEFLAEMAEAGTLEVAFGGGEPFAFKGFVTLCERLHRETPLAVSVTTNGSLLTDDVLARLAPVIGQVRLSLHDERDWRVALAALARSRVRFGVNLLVTPEVLSRLEDVVLEAVALGARDVLLLGYHGPDDGKLLSPAEDRSLARAMSLLARATGARFAADVCFGDRLGGLSIEKLGARRSDCGAGRDFVVVTSDRRMRPCSFHHDAVPFSDARALIELFARERARWTRPVLERGCARGDAARVEVGDRGHVRRLPLWEEVIR